MVKLSTLLLPSMIHYADVLCYFWQFCAKVYVIYKARHNSWLVSVFICKYCIKDFM